MQLPLSLPNTIELTEVGVVCKRLVWPENAMNWRYWCCVCLKWICLNGEMMNGYVNDEMRWRCGE